MRIAGAGLAGLIAGHIFPRSEITERSEGPGQMHQALLRFRSDEVARVTNIPFAPALVRKAIHFDGEFCQPNIRLANLYSQKVASKVLNRSIWDIEPVTRYIAPPDFYERLLDAVGHRIAWGTSIDRELGGSDSLLSTIPMPDMIRIARITAPAIDFDRAPITVQRFRVRGAAVHQTIYWPGPETPVYRASITGDLLIIESMGQEEVAISRILHAFGLDWSTVDEVGKVQQRFGKIAPIPAAIRREVIYRLTLERGVYSVGRFATWRNILLDDVVKDLRLVQQMIGQKDQYRSHLLEATSTKM